MTTTTTQAAERFVWTASRSGVPIGEAKPMTLDEVQAYLRTIRTVPIEVHAPNRISYTVGAWTWEYVGTHPQPADPHAAISDLDLIDQGLTVGQAGHLIEALRAAVDGTDPGPSLMRLLAEPVTTPAEVPAPRPARRMPTFPGGGF